FVFYFFFSSRRRHTRFSRDWSSDVCSSDLSGSARLSSTAPPRGLTTTSWSLTEAATCWGWIRHPPSSRPVAPICAGPWQETWTRSEEHTSELQSRENLVCGLLLEKKTGVKQ